MPVLKYPIGIITLFLAFGIIGSHYFDLAPIIIYAINLAGLIALVAAFWHSKKSFLPVPHFTITVLLFSFCLGMLLQTLHSAPNQKLHYSNFIHSDIPVIKGRISERLKPNDYQERYYFEVISVDNKPAKGKILLSATRDSINKLYHPGDSFIIADTPTPIAKPLNPHQFDYAANMYKQGVFHQLKLKNNYIKTETIKGFDYYLGRLREGLVGSFAIHNYSQQMQNTLNALLLGQRQDMDNDTNEAYKNAGVLHILAISGLHFSVLFYLLTIMFKPVTRIKHGKLFRLIALLAILWGFAFITGLSASVVRSVVMFSIISFGQYLNRDTNIYNSLAISMLVLLVANPYFIFDAGFQLSYLAVFAIVWLQPFYQKIKPSKYRGINYFSDTILVSLAAQLGVLPLSLYYFNQFPILFLLANLVVIPLSNIVLVLGLLILLLNFIWTDAALLLGKLLVFLVEIMNAFIGWMASFENFVFKEIPFTLLLTLLLYLSIALFGIWLYKKSYARIITFLSSILLFQGVCATTVWQHKNSEELIVFNSIKSTMLALKTSVKLTIISNDSLAKKSSIARAYSRANFNPDLKTKPLQNVLWIKDKRILIIDKDAVYNANMKPDILILTNSAKINLERLIAQLKPKQIIADGTNYKHSIKLWKATCHKLKIPFHTTAEKGFYTIK